MELVFTTQDLEPLPKLENDIVTQPLGFLNSNYQKIVKSNFERANANSIFGIKQRLKSRQFNTTCSIETVLKVSLFFVAFLMATI
ncbi:hypothetical protein Q4512_00120 [Oceanihabitans sp. 2_MG-2023]|uniref:hypothetical protein n=1 Tax=Oceanihabitans sp. 2_MG-2023 TaxID=3062661 RepID=UPI0026E159DF|nr:hypothetical protein [Oceanihabitans sp. 2_MG-2023]MDO6595295.1 hypothetical protein [Oceanihabitans sp. 2_MG-2023]